jgi:hypothetical protein
MVDSAMTIPIRENIGMTVKVYALRFTNAELPA